MAGAVAIDVDQAVALANRAAVDAADGDATHEIVAIERGDLQLQRGAGVEGRRRDALEDEVHQRTEPLARIVEVVDRPTVATRCVEHREVELVLVGLESDEEVEDLVEDAVRIGVRAVGLVDHDDRVQPQPERLAQHEARLRHRPLGGVDQEHDRIDHAEDALDLGAEVGVAGGIDDVDDLAVPLDGGVLGEDRDAPLSLEVVTVHHALVLEAGAADLGADFEDAVDERGLAVVDVRDDSDIADGLHGRSLPRRRLPRCGCGLSVWWEGGEESRAASRRAASPGTCTAAAWRRRALRHGFGWRGTWPADR